MKLTSHQFSSWKKNNKFAALSFVLIYGPDQANVDLLALQATKDFQVSSQESDISKYDFKSVKDDFSQIFDELNNTSLFGDLKIVVLNGCPQSLPKKFLDFLSAAKFVGKLVMKADELRPTSNLRKLAENHPHGLSIACYKDDVKQIQLFIRCYLQDNKAKFDDNVPQMLAQLLPNNKLIIIEELNKLMLYKLGENISLHDVELAVSDMHELAIDDLCLAIAQNNKSAILRLLSQAENHDVSFMLILRTLQRYFGRVLEVLSNTSNGLSLNSAIAKLSPPVFFKQKDNLTNVCTISSVQKILALNADLVKLELSCKRSSLDAYVLINNFFSLRII